MLKIHTLLVKQQGIMQKLPEMKLHLMKRSKLSSNSLQWGARCGFKCKTSSQVKYRSKQVLNKEAISMWCFKMRQSIVLEAVEKIPKYLTLVLAMPTIGFNSRLRILSITKLNESKITNYSHQKKHLIWLYCIMFPNSDFSAD